MGQTSKVRETVGGETLAVKRSSPALAIDEYEPHGRCFDELFEAGGVPRPELADLVEQLRCLGPDGLMEAGRRRDALFMQQGITFETAGESGASHERPFPLDLIPRVITGRGAN